MKIQKSGRKHEDTQKGEGGIKTQKEVRRYKKGGRRHEDTNIEEGLSTAIARVALCTVALFRKGVFVVYFYLQYHSLFFPSANPGLARQGSDI